MRIGTLLLAAGILLGGIILAVPLWHALQRNVFALDVNQHVRLVQDIGDCPELVTTQSATGTLPQDMASDPSLNYLAGIYALASNDPARGYTLLASSAAPSEVHLLWQGCAAARKGQTDEALQTWRTGNVTSYFVIHADYAFKQGDYTNALRLYQRATLITPDSAAAWLGVTAAYQNLATRRQADWQSMLDAAEHTLTLAPSSPQAHYLVGYALWLLDRDLPRAEAEFRWALAHREYWGDAYSLGRMLLDRGRAGEAVQLLERAQRQNDLPVIRTQLLRAYLVEGKCEDAARAYTNALKRFPELRATLDEMCVRAPNCQCS